MNINDDILKQFEQLDASQRDQVMALIRRLIDEREADPKVSPRSTWLPEIGETS